MSKDEDTSIPQQLSQSDLLKQQQSSSASYLQKETQHQSQQFANKNNTNLSLLPIQSTSIEQLQQVNEQIQSIKQVKSGSIDLLNKLSLGLRCIRSFETLSENEITDEIENINTEIIQSITGMINYKTIRNKQDVDLAIQSKFINEFLDLIRRTRFDQITRNMIESLNIICTRSSFQQSNILFQMEIFQILTPKLKNHDQDLKRYILQFFIIIISNGWKQTNSTSYSSQSSSMSSQFNLQQLLHTSYPHPYFAELQQQGIVRSIIEDMLVNEQINTLNKYFTIQLLDILYHEYIQLPSDLISLIIQYFIEKAKSDNLEFRQDLFQLLSYFTLNQEYHTEFINGGVINTAADDIKIDFENEHNQFGIITTCSRFLNNLFIIGTKQAQQLIRNLILKETLIKNKDNQDVKYLLSSYSDPEIMKELMIIERVINRRNQEQLIELIKAGLMKFLNEIITKAIQEDQLGMVLFISEIVRQLITNNPLVSRLILEQTDFIEHNINLLNSLELNKIKKEFITPLHYFTNFIANEQKKKLLEKGVVHLMIKLFESEDQNVIVNVGWTIYYIIQLGNKELKQGQQHPYHEILTNDGTIAKFIHLIQDNDKMKIHFIISLIFSNLFKAHPLPEGIKKQVLQQLKDNLYFVYIAYLAECPENHDEILSNSFENQLFSEGDEYHTLQYLRLAVLLLQLGSNPNKKKVALSVKDKVIRLTIDEYVDQLDDENKWDEGVAQEIKSKSKYAVQLIKSIEEEIEQEGEFEEINGKQFHYNEDIVMNQDNQQQEIEQQQVQNQQDLNNLQEIGKEQNNYQEQQNSTDEEIMNVENEKK